MKVIKNDADYRDALERIDNLMDYDPAAGTSKADELEVLALLVQDYELTITHE